MITREVGVEIFTPRVEKEGSKTGKKVGQRCAHSPVGAGVLKETESPWVVGQGLPTHRWSSWNTETVPANHGCCVEAKEEG